MPYVLAPDKAVHGHYPVRLSRLSNISSGVALRQSVCWRPCLTDLMWQPVDPISAIPTDRDLRLAVLKHEEVHALVFPCRRRGLAWVDPRTGRLVEVRPTHWQ